TKKLSDDIEPPSLADIDYKSATRTDLEACLRDLKIAETNAAAAIPRFEALLKNERSEMENFAHSLNLSASLTSDFLNGVDKRQARNLAFVPKMIAARADLYRVMETYTAILIQQYGKYSISANGQFVFSDRSALDRFNLAANAVSV